MNININKIITDITPLYNEYKKNQNVLTSVQSIEIMWDIGEVLQRFINENCIAPHNLYRIIYGKSEGKENIVQKSYITREFQGRCYRIRNIFEDKKFIRKTFPNLGSFTTFREAMPFFDNPKYKLKDTDFQELLVLLNSGKENNKVLKELDKKKKSIDNRKNPRTQKLSQMDEEKDLFISFYNYIFRTIKSGDFSTLNNQGVTSDLILELSKNTGALSQDGLMFQETGKYRLENSLWKEYYDLICNFSKEKNAVKTRRFRKVIPPIRIVRLADLLYDLFDRIK